jgi:arsenate reductase (glutaredoxin)
MSITLYGIPNCDSVKKARALLSDRGLSYFFHDYKKQALPEALLRSWVRLKGRDMVLNRKGTTWRALDASVKDSVVDDASAIAVMLAHLSLIKRPIVAAGKTVVVGLDLEALANL